MSTLRIEGGRVLTPDMAIERADVLVDQTTGTIEQVGASVPAGDDGLDARGCVVMPGLVNAHTHVAMTLLRGYADDKPVQAWLEEDIWPVEAALTQADIHAGAALGVLEMIKGGTTAFCDMYFEVATIAEAVERAGLRARLGYGVITAGKEPDEMVAEVERGVEVARALDGRGDGRIRTAFMPHSLTTVDRDLLAEVLPAVREAPFPVHYHANESAAFVDPIVEREDMRPLVYADEVGLLAEGDSLAHCVHLDDEEIDVLAARGAAVIHCPASNMKLASGMAPVQRLLDAGVPVGLGTDGAASNNDLDMFGELRDAALLGKLAAADARAVPAQAAVRMATTAGASAIGLPGGRVAPDAAADLAVVDLDAPNLQPVHDPVSHLAYAATGANVRHTVCDGTVLMRDRECLTLDEDAVIERASDRAASLLERATGER